MEINELFVHDRDAGYPKSSIVEKLLGIGFSMIVRERKMRDFHDSEN